MTKFINWLSIQDNQFLLFIFYASILSFILDISTNSCFKNLFSENNVETNNLKKISILEFLFLHHVLAVYLYFGWLSSSKFYLEIYVGLVLVIIFHWMTNNQKCILTQIINWYCGYNDHEWFHDIFWITGIKSKTWFNTFIYTYLTFGVILSLVKISYL